MGMKEMLREKPVYGDRFRNETVPSYIPKSFINQTNEMTPIYNQGYNNPNPYIQNIQPFNEEVMYQNEYGYVPNVYNKNMQNNGPINRPLNIQYLPQPYTFVNQIPVNQYNQNLAQNDRNLMKNPLIMNSPHDYDMSYGNNFHSQPNFTNYMVGLNQMNQNQMNQNQINQNQMNQNQMNQNPMNQNMGYKQNMIPYVQGNRFNMQVQTQQVPNVKSPRPNFEIPVQQNQRMSQLNTRVKSPLLNSPKIVPMQGTLVKRNTMKQGSRKDIGYLDKNDFINEDEEQPTKVTKKEKKEVKHKSPVITNLKTMPNFLDLTNEELCKYAYVLGRDQAGCRFIQKKIEEVDTLADNIFLAVKLNNFRFQKRLKNCQMIPLEII
jgi:hypothetical protein